MFSAVFTDRNAPGRYEGKCFVNFISRTLTGNCRQHSNAGNTHGGDGSIKYKKWTRRFGRVDNEEMPYVRSEYILL